MTGRLEKTKHTGIYRSHSRTCGWRDGGCSCDEHYEAAVYSRRDKRVIRKHFDKITAAKTWREDAGSALRRGVMVAPPKVTVGKAADVLVAGIEDGSIRNRRGEPYKPSAVRSYRRAIELRVKPELGHVRLGDLRRADVQDFIESMLRQGQSVSTIKNTLTRCA